MIESLGAERCRLLPEVTQRLAPVLPLDGDGAQVEQDERFIGPVLQLLEQDAGVALELPGPQGDVGVPGVPDDQVGPAHGDAGLAEGGQDLFVDAVGPADIGPEREEPDMVDDGLAAAAVGARVAGALAPRKPPAI